MYNEFFQVEESLKIQCTITLSTLLLVSPARVATVSMPSKLLYFNFQKFKYTDSELLFKSIILYSNEI